MSGPAKDKIGDYEILESLGQGARGRVFRARSLAANNPRVARDQIVSIKVLHLPGQDARDADRFREQAEVLCGLTHPNIIRYLDVFVWRPGEWDEVRCLVTELLEGETLDERIRKNPQGMEWSNVQTIFQQAAAALAFARSRGVVHRDIKPSNIFLTKDGAVKVFDFDIVRKEEDGQASTAAWKGTFDYMAPDFLTVPNFRGDAQSDVFSFGICFYEALTGKLPFEGLSKGAHIAYMNRWHGSEKPPEPSFRMGVFRVLANARRFVERCIHPDRAHRLATFVQVEEELGKIHYRRIKHGDKDEYELQAVLGRGGFGEVFFARRIRDGMKVAVKYLFAQKQSDRFLREAKILQRCEHPHICRYIDFFVVKSTTEEQYYIVLEYLEGMPGASLRYRIKKEGQLPVDEAVPLFINFLKAVQFLHEGKKPIIHRDLKPTNLYAPRGQPDKARIFDLGVARDVTGTVTYGGVPGTLDYMAPEFAKAGADRGSPQSDIYALGLCMYESLSGKPAFEKLPTDMNTAWTEFQKRAETRRELNFGAAVFKEHPRLAAAVRKATAWNPAERYTSAREMIRDLEQVLGTSSGEAEAATMATSATSLSVKALPSLEGEATPVPTPARPSGGQELKPSTPSSGLEGSEEPDEPDVTMATRMDGQRAGQSWAARHRTQKKLILWCGIAAVALILLVVVFRLLAGVPLRKARSEADRIVAGLEKVEPTAACVAQIKDGLTKLHDDLDAYPKLKTAWHTDIGAAESAARLVPGEFKEAFALAAVGRKTDEALRVLNEWQHLNGDVELMGLTPEQYADRLDYMKRMAGMLQFDDTMAAVTNQLPGSITDAASLKQAEDVAVQYRAVAGRSLDGISPDERKKQLDQVVAALTNAAVAYLSKLSAAAEDKSGRGEAIDAERDAVHAMADLAPALVELVRPAYDASVRRVDAASQAAEDSHEGQQLLADIGAAQNAADLDPLVQRFSSWEKAHTDPSSADLAKSLTDGMTARYRDFAMAEYKQARADYDALRVNEGFGHQKNLQVLLTLVPERFGRADLAKLDVELTALQKDAQAKLNRADAEKKQRAQEQQQKDAQAVAAQKEHDRQTAIAEADRRLVDLQKKGALGTPKDWNESVKYLIDFDTNMLRVTTVKKAWDDAAAEYARLVDAGIAQKEPLGERAARLDALQEILASKGADAVFGAGLQGLREKVETQRGKFILRLVNQALQNLTVSCGDLLRKTVIAPAQRLDITLPAKDEKTGVPLLIEGGEGYKPRTKIIGLLRGGGQELALNPLDPVAMESAPASTADAQVAAMGTFHITVSPKTARILLDDQEVQQGDLQVSSDDNHKLHIEAPGYQMYEQYYRVAAGKTKTIDILLQKEAKKSGFF